MDEDEVRSPCISVCKMSPLLDEPGGLCAGCLRSIDEIVSWGSASSTEKRATLLRIAERRAALPKLRQGRARFFF